MGRLLQYASFSGKPLKAKEYEIADGQKGNEQTIKAMSIIANARKKHPAIRALALKIIKDIPSNNSLDEAKAIGSWVRDNIKYVKDPVDVEVITDPLAILSIAAEDCDGISLLIATLLLAIGHQPKFRAVRYQSNSGPYNHIYVVDYAANGLLAGSKKRLVLDGILKESPMGTELRHASGMEFNI